MHVMTMEGLLGAGVSAKLTDTPMRAAGAAERRGDTEPWNGPSAMREQ